MRDNCFKIENAQIDDTSFVSIWHLFNFNTTQIASLFPNFFCSLPTAILSLFPIQHLKDYGRKTDRNYVQNILSRRVDTEVSVSK